MCVLLQNSPSTGALDHIPNLPLSQFLYLLPFLLTSMLRILPRSSSPKPIWVISPSDPGSCSLTSSSTTVPPLQTSVRSSHTKPSFSNIFSHPQPSHYHFSLPSCIYPRLLQLPVFRSQKGRGSFFRTCFSQPFAHLYFHKKPILIPGTCHTLLCF